MRRRFWRTGEGDQDREIDEPDTPMDDEEMDTPSDGEAIEEPDTPSDDDAYR